MIELGLPDFLGKPLAVMVVDLLLAGDNALVIGLVCVTLAPRHLRLALALGTLGAVLARLAWVVFADELLAVPGLRLVGGALLLVLALNLALPDVNRPPLPPTADWRAGVLATALLVALIDVLLSFDNVIALAAVAGDSVPYLSVGLGFSVAVVMFGGALVGRVLLRHPGLVRLGSAVLGWIAGGMLISDPLLAVWIAQQGPSLPLLVPALAAAYVYLLGRGAPVPAPPPAPARLRPTPPPRKPPRPRATPAASLPQPMLAVAGVADDARTPRSNRAELLLLIVAFAVGGLFLALTALLGGGVRL